MIRIIENNAKTDAETDAKTVFSACVYVFTTIEFVRSVNWGMHCYLGMHCDPDCPSIFFSGRKSLVAQVN